MISDWLTSAHTQSPRHGTGTMRTALYAVALPVLLIAQMPHVSSRPGPTFPVGRLHAGLAATVNSGIGLSARYRQLEPSVRKGFDFPLMASLVLSRHWGSLSTAEQNLFIDRFTRISILTYAKRFPGNGDTIAFHHRSTVPLKQGRMLVKTELNVGGDSDPVHLDYLVHRGPADEWTIIGVIVDGINELALKHGEYEAVIKRIGFSGLLAELEQQLTEPGL